MRSAIELTGRSLLGSWTLLPLAGLVGLALWQGRPESHLTHYFTSSYYTIAWFASAWGLWAGARAVSAAWSWSGVGRAGVVAGSACIGASCAVLALGWGGAVEPHGFHSLVGCIHLGAVVWLLARLPLDVTQALLVFFTATIVLPAAMPTLRPLLDASFSFRAGSFPGWSQSLTPILALIALGASLPTPPPRPGWSVHEA